MQALKRYLPLKICPPLPVPRNIFPSMINMEENILCRSTLSPPESPIQTQTNGNSRLTGGGWKCIKMRRKGARKSWRFPAQLRSSIQGVRAKIAIGLFGLGWEKESWGIGEIAFWMAELELPCSESWGCRFWYYESSRLYIFRQHSTTNYDLGIP